MAVINRKYLEAALTVLACIALVLAVLILCSCTFVVDRDGLSWELHYPGGNDAKPPPNTATRPASRQSSVPAP